jgi:putative SOS response-associated peptidase YedK
VAERGKAKSPDVSPSQEPAAVRTGGIVGWRKADGKKVGRFTIITTEPNDLIEPIYNPMPAILQPEDEGQWLDASRATFAKARTLLKPLPAELMDAHDVSTIVNSAKYDGP